MQKFIINRRAFMIGAASIALLPTPSWCDSPARPGTILDQVVGSGAVDPMLEMWNAHTDERISVRFFGPEGYDHEAVQAINWFMRDWRESSAKPVDVRLLWALATIRTAGMKEGFNGEIRFLSGYRTRKTNDMLRRMGVGAALNSYHIKARANDFTLPGIPVKTVSDYCAWLEVGGVGHYPGQFTHIDSGDERRWTG